MSSPVRPRLAPSATSPYRFAVALRLLRARRINIISILGVMVGVASIIVVLSVMDGFQKELRRVIRGTLSDVLVAVDSSDLPWADLRRAVEQVEGVEAVALQRHALGLVPVETRGADGQRQTDIGVRIIGIDPEEEGAVSDFFDSLVAEEGVAYPPDPFEVEGYLLEEDPRLVVSDWLAARIGYPLQGMPLQPGDTFQLITFRKMRDAEGELDVEASDHTCVVSRIYKSGNSEFDKLHLYAHRDRAAAALFPPGSHLTELRIKLTDYSLAHAVVPHLARAVGTFDALVSRYPEYHIETWEQRQRPFLRAVDNEKFLLAFVLFFIVLVACFTIFATLTMTVVEKTREIGVLRALGATPAGICSIFMLNGTLVGLVGALLGYGAGLLLTDNVNPVRDFLRDRVGWDMVPADIYLFDSIPTYVDHGTALAFALGAALSALLFSVVPAVRAARLKPVRALRYE
ncbi:MAG: FtsX-like permease family protein [Planctomycetota bacterium]